MGMRKASQAGYALLFVMAIGMVGLYSVTGLIGNGSATEYEAQERELLKLRAYWAGMGHITHALSRSRHGDPCGSDCSNMKKRTDSLKDIIKELQNLNKGKLVDPTKGKDRNWAYPEISSTYALPVHVHVEDVENKSRLVLRVHYQNADNIEHPFIAANWPVRVAHAAIICTGLNAVNAPCPATEADMDENHSFARIIRLEPR
jgi:hypothetical protein